MAATENSTQNLTIYIDFGASHSAVKFVDDTEDDIIGKFPTILDFDPNADEQLSFVGPGQQVRGSEVRFFKLLLVQHLILNDQEDQPGAETNQGVWDFVESAMVATQVIAGAEELVGRYLAGIWDLGFERAGEPIARERVKTVFTYPAVFDVAALDMFFAGVRFAQGIAHFGETMVHMMEHQAAAMGIERAGLLGTEEVLVVDCGGMSIDAAYANIPAGETRVAHSALGGGVWLDHLFDAAVERRIRGAPIAHQTPLQVRRLRARVMTYWQREIKPHYHGRPIFHYTREWTEGTLSIRLMDADIRQPFEATAGMIRTVITTIGSMPDNEESSMVHFARFTSADGTRQHVILTGGLSGSEFIANYLRQHLPGYQFDVPPGGARAVISGVLLPTP